MEGGIKGWTDQAEGGEQTRGVDICSPTGNTRRAPPLSVRDFQRVEVSEYVPVMVKGQRNRQKLTKKNTETKTY